MCTVTFIPRRGGYSLGMNRDEKLTRQIARPPARRKCGDSVVICPAEPGGGTWIAVNEKRVCLALINWYSIKARAGGEPVSRGEVVSSAIAASEPGSVAIMLANLPLSQINPFRLIGVFPESNTIFEWRWDLKSLVRKKHPWQAQQWISSGFDEPEAQRVRSATFRKAQLQRSAGSVAWLRRLHRSHSPEPGPFSICMHRADAATVSYTEITVSAHQAKMHYHAGTSCQGSTMPFWDFIECYGDEMR